MRMITASFAPEIERCTCHLWRHFLRVFQQVGAISKTCNQLVLIPCTREGGYQPWVLSNAPSRYN
jgi:hypothetical protein